MHGRRMGVVLAAAFVVTGCGGSSGAGPDGGGDGVVQADAAGDASLVETCVGYCQGCPDQFKDTDCSNYCAAAGELTTVSGCLAQWQAGWSCTLDAGACVQRTICSFDDGGTGGCGSSFFGTCEPAGDTFSNCVEAYCRDNKATCDEIETRYGLPH